MSQLFDADMEAATVWKKVYVACVRAGFGLGVTVSTASRVAGDAREDLDWDFWCSVFEASASRHGDVRLAMKVADAAIDEFSKVSSTDGV